MCLHKFSQQECGYNDQMRMTKCTFLSLTLNFVLPDCLQQLMFISPAITWGDRSLTVLYLSLLTCWAHDLQHSKWLDKSAVFFLFLIFASWRLDDIWLSDQLLPPMYTASWWHHRCFDLQSYILLGFDLDFCCCCHDKSTLLLQGRSVYY